jgi:hypothetical protein
MAYQPHNDSANNFYDFLHRAIREAIVLYCSSILIFKVVIFIMTATSMKRKPLLKKISVNFQQFFAVWQH